MRFRTTLILLAVLAVLGGYVLWSGRRKPVDTSASTPAIRVLQLNPNDVSAAVVRDAGGKQVRVERAGADWKLTAPRSDKADTTAVGGAIDTLAQLSATRVITPPSADLAPYGLAKPAYTVQLSKGATPLAELQLGAKNPDGSATYARRGGAATIYLVSDTVLDTVEGWLSAPPVQPTPVPATPSSTAPPATTATPAR